MEPHPQGPSEIIDLKIPRIRFTPKVAFWMITGLGTLGVTAFWQYSDTHNAEKFLPRAEYQKDQDARAEFQKSLKEDVKEIKQDLKDFMKEQRKQ